MGSWEKYILRWKFSESHHYEDQDFWWEYFSGLQHQQKEILANEFSGEWEKSRSSLSAILFHGDTIKQILSGQNFLGAFQGCSTSSCGIFLLPSDQYSSSASPISVQCHSRSRNGFIPGRFQGAVTCWITTVGVWGSVFPLSLGFSTG